MSIANQTADTDAYIANEHFKRKFFDATDVPLQFTFGAASHTGKVRPNNEDHYAVVRRRRTSELLLTNMPAGTITVADESAYAAVVADGMGGQRFGDFASRLALQTMFELAQRATGWVMRFTDLEVQQIHERVEAYVHQIQATMREYIDSDPALAGMGTTWTSAHLLGHHAIVVHIGDSRAYTLHDDGLRQITHDETVAQAFVDSGMDADSVTKFRHLLLKSFGGDKEEVSAQVHHVQIGPGDRILLCTDGLTDMVGDDDIKTTLREHSHPQVACDELVQKALHNGGRDNVTVVVAAVTA